MPMIEDFETVTGVFEDEFTLKGSRFIGISMPCPTEGHIKPNLEDVMKRYPNATHYCYAAVFGGSERGERSSDNGEPAGTAGKPMAAGLKGSGLTDVMVVSVRYFGGTLLGTGGLVHAYTESAKQALSGIVRKRYTACCTYTFSLDYHWYSVFESKCRDMMAKRPECEFGMNVDVKAWILTDREDEFVRRITDLTERHVRLVKGRDEYI